MNRMLAMLPSLVLPLVGLIYLIVWYFSSVKPQAGFVRTRWGKDYPRRPWGKPLAIGFGIWIGIWVLIGVAVSMTGMPPD